MFKKNACEIPTLSISNHKVRKNVARTETGTETLKFQNKFLQGAGAQTADHTDGTLSMSKTQSA